MNILNEINNILLSALNVQQKQLVDKIMKHNKKEIYSSYDHMFGVGNNRIYLPETIEVDRDFIIDNYIEENMYSDEYELESTKRFIKYFYEYLNKPIKNIELDILDYYKGKIKIDNREYNIGKLLNQINKNKEKLKTYYNNIKIEREKKFRDSLASNKTLPELAIVNMVNIHNSDIGDFLYRLEEIHILIRHFNSRLNINSIKDLELKIVISRDPYDIAGMSTDRRWNSCMTMKGDKKRPEGGGYRNYLFGDLSTGTLIAYLVDKDDNDINDPYARVLIKPFINKDKEIFLSPEERVYYDENYLSRKHATEFSQIVTDWTEEQQKEIEGTFYAHPNLYHDGKEIIKRKKIKEDNNLIPIEDIIFDNIDWERTVPPGSIKVSRKFFISTNVDVIDDFIKSWNSVSDLYLSKLKNEYKYIHKFETEDEYRDLNFHVDLTDDHSDSVIVTIDELEKELNRMLKLNKGVNSDSKYDHILNTLKNEIDIIKKQKNNMIEIYDLIFVRKIDKTFNKSNVIFEDASYLNNTKDNIFNKHRDSQKYSSIPLFYAYIVKSKDKLDYKNKAILEMTINLDVNVDRIKNNIDDIFNIFDYNAINVIHSESCFYYGGDSIGLSPEFNDYIKSMNGGSIVTLLKKIHSALMVGNFLIHTTDELTKQLAKYLHEDADNVDLNSYYQQHNIRKNDHSDKYYELEKDVYSEN